MAQLRSFRRWIRLVCIVEGVIGAIAVVVMMALVSSDVIGRDTMSKAVPGTYELVQYGMVVAVCAAFAVTQSNRSHVRVDVVVSLLPARWRAAIESFTLMLVLVYAGAIVWVGRDQVMTIMARHVTSQVLFIARWPFQLWLIVGWGVFFLATLADFLLAVGHALGKDGETGLEQSEEQFAAV